MFISRKFGGAIGDVWGQFPAWGLSPTNSPCPRPCIYFYPRDAMLARLYATFPSVCFVSKRPNVSSKFFYLYHSSSAPLIRSTE